MPRENADTSGTTGEKQNLPPPLRERLRKILADHSHAIIHDRASVVRERRGDGRPYWRLYLESGSGPERQRKRVYVGPEGGPELRQAILEARRDFWLGCDSFSDFIRAVEKILENERRQAREARDAARACSDAPSGKSRVQTRLDCVSGRDRPLAAPSESRGPDDPRRHACLPPVPPSGTTFAPLCPGRASGVYWRLRRPTISQTPTGPDQSAWLPSGS